MPLLLARALTGLYSISHSSTLSPAWRRTERSVPTGYLAVLGHYRRSKSAIDFLRELDMAALLADFREPGRKQLLFRNSIRKRLSGMEFHFYRTYFRHDSRARWLEMQA